MMAPPQARRDPERSRRIVGAVLYGLFMLLGMCALVFAFGIAPLLSDDPSTVYASMGIGALCAIPPLFVYIWIPRLLDRFDPEPWWVLALVLAWGAVAASGVAFTINSLVGFAVESVAPGAGRLVMACVSAPIFEEGMKGLAVLGVFYFLRREFDGAVDGVIYATFAALGFAAIENVEYYARAAAADSEGIALAGTLALRGVLAPWLHPLFTSMTGLGFGISRETERPWLRWLAPMGGYCCAMFLHCTWNASSSIPGLIFLALPVFILFMLGFVALLIVLVVRKGRIIRMHLQDEVLLGNLTREELALTTSAFGRFRAWMSWGGSAGSRFVRTAARLGLCKWHAGRAMKGSKRTASADWIVPLRQELFALRNDVARALGRAVPQPLAWTPGAAQQQPAAQGQWTQGWQAPGAQYPPRGWGR